MRTPAAIPGAGELMGRGVYRGVPRDVPLPVRDGHAVVVGPAAACATAARRVGDAGWRVTVVTRERAGGSGPGRRCGRRGRTELVCASGIAYLEAVVLRRVDNGRLEACNASALFVL